MKLRRISIYSFETKNVSLEAKMSDKEFKRLVLKGIILIMSFRIAQATRQVGLMVDAYDLTENYIKKVKEALNEDN